MKTPVMFRCWLTGLLTACLVVTAFAATDSGELAPDHPRRYTVQEGDTLWEIAARFLKDPWKWRTLLKTNPQIKNPDRIRPGDVIVLTTNGEGEPELRLLRREKLSTVRLSPAVYSEPIPEPVPTIPPTAITPFLIRPLVIDKGDLDGAGYVSGGVDDNIAFGKYSQVYARGVDAPVGQRFLIFRPGQRFIDPDSDELLGYEMIHIGTARVLATGDPAKLEITDSRQEISPGARLVPAPDTPTVPLYTPQAPDKPVQGRILAAQDNVSEMGPMSVVVLSRGRRDGLDRGHVLRIMRHADKQVDPVTGSQYQPPDESSGLLMVFHTLDKVSYGLVLRASRAIHVLDTVRTP